MACISLILSSKVNKVDFKCSGGFLEKVAVVDIALKVETQLHNNIYVENNIKVKQNQPRRRYCSYNQSKLKQ